MKPPPSLSFKYGLTPDESCDYAAVEYEDGLAIVSSKWQSDKDHWWWPKVDDQTYAKLAQYHAVPRLGCDWVKCAAKKKFGGGSFSHSYLTPSNIIFPYRFMDQHC